MIAITGNEPMLRILCLENAGLPAPPLFCYNHRGTTRRKRPARESAMPHYHEPPATLTEAEWDKLEPIFKSCGQHAAFLLLRKTRNRPQRAGDLFAPEDVRSRGRDSLSTALRRANSVFALSRINYVGGGEKIEREEHMLALVRIPKKV